MPRSTHPLVGAFTAGQASRVSGVRYRTLDYWAKSAFLTPSAQAAEGTGTWRGYTFRDLVQLRVARRLRDAGISLQGLRKVQQRLKQERDLEAPLAETYLATNGRDVFEVQHGKEEVWSLLQQPAQRGFTWIILNLSHTVAELRYAVEADQLKVG